MNEEDASFIDEALNRAKNKNNNRQGEEEEKTSASTRTGANEFGNYRPDDPQIENVHVFAEMGEYNRAHI